MNRQFLTLVLSQEKRRRAGALLAALVVTAALSACGAADASSSAGTGSGSAPASGSTAQDASLQAAESWAKAVKGRDGKAQYDLMTPELQKSVHDEFAGLNWVTGTSSPWVETYAVQKSDTGAQVVFDYAASTGPAGSYRQDLTFQEQDGAVKISGISDPVQVDSPADGSGQSGTLSFSDLIGLLGMTKDQVTAAVGETPVSVDEGGLGFEKAGIRAWFDDATHTKVAQVLIMTDAIDLNGVHKGDSFSDFKKVFGEPISDRNGDAHFKYDDVYLSVVRDTSSDSGKIVGIYILQEDF